MPSILGLIKFCIVSFLSLLTIPLALLAGFTTFAAIVILFIRVSVVYVDFVVSLIPTYIFGRRTYDSRIRNAKPPPILAASPSLSSTSTYTRRRYGRAPTMGAISPEPFAPVTEHAVDLTTTPGMDRDFEGLGGWRDDDDDHWVTLNSRFRLGDGAGTSGQGHHYRTLSGGRILRSQDYDLSSRSPGAMTPVSSNTKVRRPPPNLAPPPLTAVGKDRLR